MNSLNRLLVSLNEDSVPRFCIRGSGGALNPSVSEMFKQACIRRRFLQRELKVEARLTTEILVIGRLIVELIQI